MSSFIVLGNWTERGITNIQEAPNRIKTTHDLVEKAGGKMQLYYTIGEYDFVMVVEVPSHEAIVTVLARLGSMGNVRTKTLKAWTEAEGAKILVTAHK
ncbi:MAG TPA: GYD domain-containing protein [Candidatus Binatia bacterium]|nr:GYD domain-containing protein [Candidatus Binatia bacterium]